MGGEKTFASRSIICMKGSPPRRRGKVCFGHLVKVSLRITPAWAGKSAGERQRPPCPQDHPRVGGEKLLPSDTLFLELGSPPRGRGKALSPALALAHVRITPA